MAARGPEALAVVGLAADPAVGLVAGADQAEAQARVAAAVRADPAVGLAAVDLAAAVAATQARRARTTARTAAG